MKSKKLLENKTDNSESNRETIKKKLENQQETSRIIQKYFVIKKEEEIMKEISY